MTVHVIKVDWHARQDALKDIRFEVFVNEQNVPLEEELDGLDDRGSHFLALNDAGQAVGCARLLPTGQIGRMAVRQPQRGLGIGAQLLGAAVAEAQALGMNKVFLHAQTYAEEFYRKGGFIGLGDRFMDAGIEHTTMELMLPIAFARSEAPLQSPIMQPSESSYQETRSKPITFDSRDTCLKALLSTLLAAKRNAVILSPYLDQDYFAQQDVVQALSDHARSAPKATLRILIMSSKHMVSRGHPLVDLARRLDEKIKIRLLDEPITTQTSSFVCVDQSGYWLLPDHTLPSGVSDLGNPVLAQRFMETFETAWEKAKPDPELRELRL